MSLAKNVHLLRRAMAALLCLTMPLASVSHADSASSFAYARAPYQFVFPRDHASHPQYRTEWWYYTGHLQTKGGRRFGYELTFFRYGLRPGDPPRRRGQSNWRGNELFPAHFAITDEAGQRFVHVEQLMREALNEGFASATQLAVRSGSWTLAGKPERDPLRERMVLHADAGSNALDLIQEPQKPPAIHGSGGVSRKSACLSCASHYYSYTRLRTTGTLTFDGTRFPVAGLSWMDHEFGSAELAADQVGWDWFSIQLNDGRELMLYVLRQKDGSVTPQSSGSLIERDGSVHALALAEFSAQASGFWESPHTAARYPSGWRVRVPSKRIDVTLTPTVADQELAEPSGTSYWEGAVDVYNANGSAKPTGVGYVELTGYAQPVRL